MAPKNKNIAAETSIQGIDKIPHTAAISPIKKIIDAAMRATQTVYEPLTQEATRRIQDLLSKGSTTSSPMSERGTEQENNASQITPLKICLEPGPGIHTPSYAESLRSSLLQAAQNDPHNPIIPIILPFRFYSSDKLKRLNTTYTREEYEDLRSQIIQNIRDCAKNLEISLDESSTDSNNPLLLLKQLQRKAIAKGQNPQIIFILPEIGQSEQETGPGPVLHGDIKELYIAAREAPPTRADGETLNNPTSIRIVEHRFDQNNDNRPEFSHIVSYRNGMYSESASSSEVGTQAYITTWISDIEGQLEENLKLRASYLLELISIVTNYDIPTVFSILKIIQDEYPDIFEIGGDTIDNEPDANAFDPDPRKSSEQQIIEAIHTRLLEEKIGFNFEYLKRVLYLRPHYNNFREFSEMLDKYREELREVYCFALLFGKLFDQDKDKRKILFEPILIEMIARLGLIRKKVYYRYEGTDLFQDPKAIGNIVRIALRNKSARDQDKRDIANKLIPEVRKGEYRELIQKLLPVFFALWILVDKKDDLGNHFPEDYINSSDNEEELDITDIISEGTTLLNHLLSILKGVKKGTDYKIEEAERIPRTSKYGQLVISFAKVVGIDIENYPQLANMFQK